MQGEIEGELVEWKYKKRLKEKSLSIQAVAYYEYATTTWRINIQNVESDICLES